MKSLRVEAPHFVALALFNNGSCFRAAPIMKWMVGHSEEYAKSWLAKKQYLHQWEEIEDASTEKDSDDRG